MKIPGMVSAAVLLYVLSWATYSGKISPTNDQGLVDQPSYEHM